MALMKNNLPIHALTISYLGAITTFLTDAKSLFGAMAAMASFVASCYAIAIASRRLKKLRGARRRPYPRRSFLSAVKKRLASVRSVFSVLILVLFLTGCSTSGHQPGQSVFNRIVEFPGRLLDSAATLVTTTITNVVEQPVVSTEIPTHAPSDSNSVHSPQSSQLRIVTNIVAVPNATIARTINTAEAASGFLPPPYGEVAAGGLALVSALLAAAVRRRNAMLKTVIRGVENAGQGDVKESVFTESLLNGNSRDLHALVKQVTK